MADGSRIEWTDATGARLMVGFTDRGLLREERHPHAPDAARERVEVVVNLHRERPDAVLVSLTLDVGLAPVWLPRRQIEIQPVATLARGRETLRIRLPRWLAADRGLLAGADERQGRLL